MIRVSGELRRAQGTAGVPSVEEYLDRVHLLLWPRFKVRPLRCSRHPGTPARAATRGSAWLVSPISSRSLRRRDGPVRLDSTAVLPLWSRAQHVWLAIASPLLCTRRNAAMQCRPVPMCACRCCCCAARPQLVFDNQLASVRQGTERQLFQESPAPHAVVRRYAALSASMLLLMAQYDAADTPGERPQGPGLGLTHPQASQPALQRAARRRCPPAHCCAGRMQDDLTRSDDLTSPAPCYPFLCPILTLPAGMFKAQNFYDMMDRLWASIFDLLLRMSNMFRDKRMGIIFLITQYHHIHSTLRCALFAHACALPVCALCFPRLHLCLCALCASLACVLRTPPSSHTPVRSPLHLHRLRPQDVVWTWFGHGLDMVPRTGRARDAVRRWAPQAKCCSRPRWRLASRRAADARGLFGGAAPAAAGAPAAGGPAAGAAAAGGAAGAGGAARGEVGRVSAGAPAAPTGIGKTGLAALKECEVSNTFTCS